VSAFLWRIVPFRFIAGEIISFLPLIAAFRFRFFFFFPPVFSFPGVAQLFWFWFREEEAKKK
jgi:hypothetical protein